MRGALSSLVILLLVAVAAPTLAAQGSALPGAEGVDTAEILVKRIQAQQAEVDAALARAAEADVAADDVAAAKRGQLAVIRDIEALIKQVKYQQSGNPRGGGQGGGGQSSGGKASSEPQTQPSDGSSAPTPSGGKPQDGRQEAGTEGSQPAGAQPGEAESGSNERGGTLPPDQTGRFTRTDTDARWGVLPPKLQERLNNLQVDDVPERYRAWLEAYIHALNSREQAAVTR